MNIECEHLPKLPKPFVGEGMSLGEECPGANERQASLVWNAILVRSLEELVRENNQDPQSSDK